MKNCSQQNPLRISIIGGGFCGVMTAVNLIENVKGPISINIINSGNPLFRGVAYNPHSENLLLNVPNYRMSAYVDKPDHFVKWLMEQNCGKMDSNIDLDFSSREQYGDYLTYIWASSIKKKNDNTEITVFDDFAIDILPNFGNYSVYLRSNRQLPSDLIIIATGNTLPRIPSGINFKVAQSIYYYNNPWTSSSIENLRTDGDILIIGNGLTMVDTVVGLLNNEFPNTIYTISPNGNRLNPWKEAKKPYTDIRLEDICDENLMLLPLLNFINKHRKKAEKLNCSFFQTIDNLRPYTQKIWQSLTNREKQRFMHYLRHLWGSFRHRLPKEMFDKMEKMKSSRKLISYKGLVTDTQIIEGVVHVELDFNGVLKKLKVQRIINCTGPENDFRRVNNSLLWNIEKRGLICSDNLNLGIKADPCNFNVINQEGQTVNNIYTLGCTLKGTLWESTAVPELRYQAKKLSENILNQHC